MFDRSMCDYSAVECGASLSFLCEGVFIHHIYYSKEAAPSLQQHLAALTLESEKRSSEHRLKYTSAQSRDMWRTPQNEKPRGTRKKKEKKESDSPQ